VLLKETGSVRATRALSGSVTTAGGRQVCSPWSSMPTRCRRRVLGAMDAPVASIAASRT